MGSKYSPSLEAKFTSQHKKTIGSSWRMDETYIRIKRKWCYLYRAVDKSGKTIDFMLAEIRDKAAAKRFFDQAIGLNKRPEKITIDKSGSNKSALNAINKTFSNDKKILIRQIKYLNNIVEQDHRFIKRITKPTKGIKSFQAARATLIGVELHHMLRKQQHVNAANSSVFRPKPGYVRRIAPKKLSLYSVGCLFPLSADLPYLGHLCKKTP